VEDNVLCFPEGMVRAAAFRSFDPESPSWSIRCRRRSRWEQAFSGDGGKTWETNWTMEFHRQ
jgi:hypothetical protein